MNETRAQDFATQWINAWNSHDLDSILSHYADDIEFTSPFVIRLSGDQSGTLHGKDALRAYFQTGLDAYPDLKFELLDVFSGVGSLTLHYRSVNNLTAAEVMIFDENGKVAKVLAHYA